MPTTESLERHIGNIEAENRNLRAKVESMTTHLDDVKKEMSDLATIMGFPGFVPNVGGVDRVMWFIDMLRGDDWDEFIERFRKEYGDELASTTEEDKPLSPEVLDELRRVQPRHGESFASTTILDYVETGLLVAIADGNWKNLDDSFITQKRLEHLLIYGLIKDVEWQPVEDGNYEPTLTITGEGVRHLARLENHKPLWQKANQ